MEKKIPEPTEKEMAMYKKEIKKHFDAVSKHFDKLLSRIHNRMGDNNDSIDFLLEQFKKDPNYLVYALSDEIHGRKFLKWALAENIKRNQSLIDLINKIEKEHKLPTEYTD